jgi:iron complex transport system permease protein
MGIDPATPQRLFQAVAWSALAALAALILTPLAGPTALDWSRVTLASSMERQILWELRLPRVLLAMLAGGCLSLAGALFQALLRDALATPYTLGVSSGAALGAVAAICLGWTQAFYLPAVWVAAFVGAAGALLIVLLIATEGNRMSSFTLLLAGVTINSMCLALILFLHNLAGFTQSFSISRWLMGGVDAVEYPALAWLSAITLAAVALILRHARDWNLLAVGEDWASARGLSPRRLLLTGYLAGSVLTGAVTALTGPIGFVGLIVPHALRLRVGADHRVLMPCSFLVGAAFLAVCDALARTVLAPAEVPVGVITAMCGGPFFIWLLRTRRRSLWL